LLEEVPSLLPHQVEPAEAATALVVALGCGLLVGIERERRKGQGPTRAFAGLRTFSIAAVLGAGTALTGLAGLVVAGAGLLAGLGVVAHLRDRSPDPGATTEVALLLTYLIGVLAAWSPSLAAAMAVALTGLLAARDRLHRLASQWLSAGEVRDGIILGALVLIALPLMPNRPFWGPVLNPYLITQLLALLLAIQSLAHLGRRLLEARQAVALSSIAAGFVSSTATIASHGMAVRQGRSGARMMAGAGLLSCVPTLLQLLVVALAVQPAWWRLLLWPVVAGALIALVWGGWLVRGAPAEGSEWVPSSPRVEGVPIGVHPPSGGGAGRMFSLRGAALVALLLTLVQVLVYGMGLWLGQAGQLAGTLLAALVDVHSAAAAIFVQGPPDGAGAGLWAIMLALSAHALSKAVTAWLAGGARYVAWLVPGLWVHTAVCVLALGLLR
jgi:uncharacterized membrane protein (DUF4010 family)